MTTAELVARIRAAKPGDTVVTGPVVIPDRLRLSKISLGGVTLDATGALFLEGASFQAVHGLKVWAGAWGTVDRDTSLRSAIEVANSEDFSVAGGLFNAGPGGDRNGVKFASCRRVTARDNLFFGHRQGIGVQGCEDILVTRNTFRRMVSDGINLIDNQRGIVSENDCEWHVRFGKSHPDGIQMWTSRVEGARQSDLFFLNNRAVGNMQAFLSGKLHPTGVTERLHFHGNMFWPMFSHTITVTEAKNCVVTHNVLASHPGALHGPNPGKIKGFEDPSNVVRDNVMWNGTVNPPPRIWWMGDVGPSVLDVGSQFDDRRYRTATTVVV